MLKLICGKNSVFDALNSNLDLEIIYTTRPQELPSTTATIKVVNKLFLDQLTNRNHQGFIAKVRGFKYDVLATIWQDAPTKVLLLDHIQDVQNLGAIIRAANALGVQHVILPKDRAAQIDVAAFKVASGGFTGMKIIRVSSLVDAVVKLKQHQYWIYSSSVQNGEDIKKITFNHPLCLIVGNEHKGVSRTLLKMSDQHVMINMTGQVQSLNVASATAIMLSWI